jgi:hypothetical protein
MKLIDLFVFWYHSPNVLDTPHICNISRLRVNVRCGVTLNVMQYFSKCYCRCRLPSGVINIHCILAVASDKTIDHDLLVQAEPNRKYCIVVQCEISPLESSLSRKIHVHIESSFVCNYKMSLPHNFSGHELQNYFHLLRYVQNQYACV